MRVLFVNVNCGYFGGVEQYIADTAKGLAGRGHECHLAYGNQTAAPGLDEYKHLFVGAHPCAELGTGDSFVDILRSVEPDVVYLHKLDHFTALAPHLAKVRTVRVVHDHDLCCPTGYKYYRRSGKRCTHAADWRCWLDGASLARDRESSLGVRYVSIPKKMNEMRANRSIDQFLVLSEFMRDELVQSGFDPARISVCPPIVRFPDHEAEALPLEPKLLYVGQLIRGKGVDLLLRAAAAIEMDFRLTIVGDGNAREQLEGLADELGLSERYDFRGWVDPDELGAVYADSKIVVVPSRWPEPYGMVGLEAMHQGRPVVAFDIGGIPDWLRHEETGLLVPEADVDGLREAITRLLRDDQLASKFGARAAKLVRESYSFERYLDDLEGHLAG